MLYIYKPLSKFMTEKMRWKFSLAKNKNVAILLQQKTYSKTKNHRDMI